MWSKLATWRRLSTPTRLRIAARAVLATRRLMRKHPFLARMKIYLSQGYFGFARASDGTIFADFLPLQVLALY